MSELNLLTRAGAALPRSSRPRACVCVGLWVLWVCVAGRARRFTWLRLLSYLSANRHISRVSPAVTEAVQLRARPNLRGERIRSASTKRDDVTVSTARLPITAPPGARYDVHALPLRPATDLLGDSPDDGPTAARGGVAQGA